MSLPKELNIAHTQKYLNEAAAACAQVLIEHGKGKRKRLQTSRQRACEYVIDHAIGKARQKIEHSGGILTYAALAKDAEKLDSKPRPILADALEIAHKYQEETPAEVSSPKDEEGELPSDG